jgi:hypothetical protein
MLVWYSTNSTHSSHVKVVLIGPMQAASVYRGCLTRLASGFNVKLNWATLFSTVSVGLFPASELALSCGLSRRVNVTGRTVVGSKRTVPGRHWASVLESGRAWVSWSLNVGASGQCKRSSALSDPPGVLEVTWAVLGPT